MTIFEALKAIGDFRTRLILDSGEGDDMRWNVSVASGVFDPVEMDFEQTEQLEAIAAAIDNMILTDSAE